MRIFAALALLILAACDPAPRETMATAPPMDYRVLERRIGPLVDAARPGALGVGVLSLDGGEAWSSQAGRPFPLQSVFKLPLGAAVLAEVDAGRLRLDEPVTIGAMELSPPYSPVADAWPGRKTYTVRQLLVRAVGASDNTAADVLMHRIGGPGVVDAWLRENEIEAISIDRYERELQTEIAGLAPFRPEWKGEAAFAAAMAKVPQARRRAALRAYLRDPRDSATVGGALSFLRKLADGDLLSERSTALLLNIMTDTATGQGRLKAGLPPDARLAHKTGTARTVAGINPATNDIGIITLNDGRRYAVAVFLAASPADEAERDTMIAKVAEAVVEAAG